jgi:putative membrane protein
MENSRISPDLREYLAAERTVLAYVRTGLSMMGIGFVVARFGLFLRLMQLNMQQMPAVSSGRSLWLGTALVVLGSIVTVLSARQYWFQVQQLNQRLNSEAKASYLALGLAIILSGIGILMAAYLIVSSP